ncbi:nitrogen regulation protein NR(II) [Kangiella sediminilitoris]|uniref:Sensory histidine kinase/phosphatase NtrB n=1 Tax=Kangiella sediminilitoris TaxID=1144748 RepID=A0A1B3B8C2_9GAMM|nr:nitrogen regulation protein NR(II) [Kangiella sediminilitoris]AOE49048.1 Signal transduction histidine kinase, nitrogen specific, NtrB [Kangiella sediminilitoris]
MQFDRLLDNLSTSIIVFDAHGRFTYLNQAAEKAFSTSSKVLQGKRYSYFIASDSLPLHDIIEGLRQNGQFILDGVSLELLNGKQLTVDLTGHWFTAEEPYLIVEWQNPQHFPHRGLARGLSQQNQVSERLLQKLAHEIKNPLSGIRGAAQLLQHESASSSSPEESIGELTDIIEQESNRLTELVNRMLLSTNKPTLVEMNIHETTEKVLELSRINLPDKIELIRDYDPSLPDFYGAPDSVYQAVLNLTQNAIEAVETQQQGQVTIRTRALPRHTIGDTQYPITVCVQVEDNGPGIPAELQPNIFFPLISGKNSSGLGLGIAQSLIQQQKGIIEFSTNAEKTCFSIYLPILKDEELKPLKATSELENNP